MTEKDDEQLEQGNQEAENITPEPEGDTLPSGIMRLHEEWLEQGLLKSPESKQPAVGLEPIIFPEPVGDYRVPAEEARLLLGLSEEAMERLLSGGELDSILIKSEDGTRRMVSRAALARFLEDSGMTPDISERLAASSQEVASELQIIREEMREMRELHSRQLQQFKDVLLLELRNLKEQDRDLTSFIYDLTAGLEDVFPKLKKRKKTPPPQKSEE